QVDRSPRRERRRDEVVQPELRRRPPLPEARPRERQAGLVDPDHHAAFAAVNPRHSRTTRVHTPELRRAKSAKSRNLMPGAALALRAPQGGYRQMLLFLGLALALAACGTTIHQIATNQPPHPLTARPAETVEVFTATQPQRPFVEVAYFEA